MQFALRPSTQCKVEQAVLELRMRCEILCDEPTSESSSAKDNDIVFLVGHYGGRKENDDEELVIFTGFDYIAITQGQCLEFLTPANKTARFHAMISVAKLYST